MSARIRCLLTVTRALLPVGLAAMAFIVEGAKRW
jgi:hypothetical protein